MTRKTREQVQAELRLDRCPDDDFMRLVAEVGDAEVVSGPTPEQGTRIYSPDEIEEIILVGTVGALLARARDEAARSLAEVAEASRVSRARVQQIERSDNIEIATLVRFASACGYEVHIGLRPVTDPTLPILHSVLPRSVD